MIAKVLHILPCTQCVIIASGCLHCQLTLDLLQFVNLAVEIYERNSLNGCSALCHRAAPFTLCSVSVLCSLPVKSAEIQMYLIHRGNVHARLLPAAT